MKGLDVGWYNGDGDDELIWHDDDDMNKRRWRMADECMNDWSNMQHGSSSWSLTIVYDF